MTLDQINHLRDTARGPFLIGRDGAHVPASDGATKAGLRRGGSDLTVPLGGAKPSGNGQDKSLHAPDKIFDLTTASIKL